MFSCVHNVVGVQFSEKLNQRVKKIEIIVHDFFLYFVGHKQWKPIKQWNSILIGNVFWVGTWNCTHNKFYCRYTTCDCPQLWKILKIIFAAITMMTIRLWVDRKGQNRCWTKVHWTSFVNIPLANFIKTSPKFPTGSDGGSSAQQWHKSSDRNVDRFLSLHNTFSGCTHVSVDDLNLHSSQHWDCL